MADRPSAPSEDEEILLDMSEILPGALYLGSRRAAHSYKALDKRKVTDIICVLIEDPRYREIKRDAYRYHNIPLADSTAADLARHFAQCHDVIAAARAKQSAVLVHCEAGVSRSPTIVISYLMRAERMSLVEAYRFVQKRRRFIAPNWGFLRQLSQYELRLFPTATPPPSLGLLLRMQFPGTFDSVSPERIQMTLERHNCDIMATIEELCETEQKNQQGKEV